MQFESFQYTDFTFNGPFNRKEVKSLGEITAAIPKDGADHYVCLYRYRRELLDWFEEHQTIKGHSCVPWCDWLYFDFDDAEQPGNAQIAARQVVDALVCMGVPLQSIAAFFTGNKGFHVLVPLSLFGATPERGINNRIKRLALHVANGVSIDKGIYDQSRIFRLVNTLNSKGGLYKVSLPTMALNDWSIDQIKTYANTVQPIYKIDREPGRIPALADLWAKTAEEPKATIRRSESRDCPKNTKACIHDILQGVGEGEVHNASLRLSVHFRRQGFPDNATIGLLSGWGPLCSPPANEDFGGMVADAGNYDFGCNDPILAAHCSKLCYLFGTEKKEVKFYNLDEQEALYAEYVKNLNRKRFLTGLVEVDAVIRGVAPGEVMMITAYSATFKSAFLQNMLLDNGNRGQIQQAFFSLEMPVVKAFERTLQITSGEHSHLIEEGYRVGNNLSKSAKAKAQDKGGKYLSICEENGLTIEQIEEAAQALKEKHGDLGSVAIDYLGLMRSKHQSEYERISYLAESCKGLAKRLNVPVIVLVQVSRNAAREAKDSESIGRDAGKGSGAIEASGDYQLGMFRNEDGDLIMQITKNRNGMEGDQFKVRMEGLKFVDATAHKLAKKTIKGPVKIKKKEVSRLPDDGDIPSWV